MSMFCFQCEQTSLGKGCTVNGVCGKKADTANLQDELVNSLINLANCAEKNDKNTELIIDGLFTTVTNVNFDNASIEILIEEVNSSLNCDNKFDVQNIWNADEDIKSLKSLILFGLKGMAAYAHHARVLGYRDDDVDNFFMRSYKKFLRT